MWQHLTSDRALTRPHSVKLSGWDCPESKLLPSGRRSLVLKDCCNLLQSVFPEKLKISRRCTFQTIGRWQPFRKYIHLRWPGCSTSWEPERSRSVQAQRNRGKYQLFFNLEVNVEITCETIALSSPEAPCYRICHHVMRNWALWRQSNKRWATLNIDKKPSLARMNCRVHEGDVPKNTKDSEYSIFKCFTSNQEEEKVFQIQKFTLNLHEMCQPDFLIFFQVKLHRRRWIASS